MPFIKNLTAKRIITLGCLATFVVLICFSIFIYLTFFKSKIPKSTITPQVIYHTTFLWEDNVVFDEYTSLLIFQDNHSLLGLDVKTNEIITLIKEVDVGSIRAHIPKKLVVAESENGKKYKLYHLDSGMVTEARQLVPRHSQENSIIDANLKELVSKSDKVYYHVFGHYTTYIFEKEDRYTIIGRYDAETLPGSIPQEKIFFGHLNQPINIHQQEHYAPEQIFTSKDKQIIANLKNVVYEDYSDFEGRIIRSYNQLTVTKNGKEVGKIFEKLERSKGFLFFPGNSSRIYYWGVVGGGGDYIKMVDI